jgi:hypothetical protein
VDLEVRGVPALGYFGNVVWRDVFDRMNAGATGCPCSARVSLVQGNGGLGKWLWAGCLAAGLLTAFVCVID